MAKCLNVDCINEVVSQEGKRQKKTCSDSCRQKVWQRNKQSSKYIKVTIEQWKEMLLKATIGVPKKEVVIRVKGKEDWENLASTENELLKKIIELTIQPIQDKISAVENDIIKKNIEAVVSVPLPNQKKKEFRPFVKGENSVSYSEEKREWKLNNQ